MLYRSTINGLACGCTTVPLNGLFGVLRHSAQSACPATLNRIVHAGVTDACQYLITCRVGMSTVNDTAPKK